MSPGPNRPVVSILGVLDPRATMVLLVHPRDLLASPLGTEVGAWFRPTREEAARGGPASWLRDLGGAEEVAVALWGEGEDADLALAVRGGDAEARALARGFADGASARGARMVDERYGDVPLVTAGGVAVAGLARDVFLSGPRDGVISACRRVAGEEPQSLATDPRVEPLAAEIDLSAAQIVYFGRVPATVRPQLQHWGLDPLVDRVIGVSATISDEDVAIRLVADLEDEAATEALVAGAVEGIEFAASRRSFEVTGVSGLIRRLAPRRAGTLFFIEGSLPTPIVAAIFARLRTVTDAAGGAAGGTGW